MKTSNPKFSFARLGVALRRLVGRIAHPGKTEITDALPPKGEWVKCFRRWTPCHIGNDGSVRREILIARRLSSAPLTVNKDASRNCWWDSSGDGIGTFSDSTVEAWAPLKSPNAKLTDA